MDIDRPTVGWHPAPNGLAELWYFDGSQWIDPIENVQERITEMVIPHLEAMYRKGFEAGVMFTDTETVLH